MKAMKLELDMLKEGAFVKAARLKVGETIELNDGRLAKVVESGIWEYDDDFEEEMHKNIKFIEIIEKEEYDAINKDIENRKRTEEEAEMRMKNLIAENRAYIYENSDLELFTNEALLEYRKSEKINSNEIGTFYKTENALKLLIIAGYDTIIRKINLEEEEVINICKKLEVIK